MAAMSHVGPTTALEELIREALRRCPRPATSCCPTWDRRPRFENDRELLLGRPVLQLARSVSPGLFRLHRLLKGRGGDNNRCRYDDYGAAGPTLPGYVMFPGPYQPST